MLEMIVEKAKGLLLNPVETFQKSRADAIEQSILYYSAIVLVHAVLSILVAFLILETGTVALFDAMVKQLGVVMPLLGVIGAIVAVIAIEFFAVVFVFIIGGWLHLWVYLLGGRKGYTQTVKAMALGATPYMLIGWIPFIGPVIGGIWSFVLEILGVREMQEISTARAAAAVIIAGVVIAILVAFLAALFFIAAVSSVSPVPPTKIY